MYLCIYFPQTNKCEMRIELKVNGTKYFAKYSTFAIASETENFRLQLSGYSGDAGDAMLYDKNPDWNIGNMPFSTKDQDHDNYLGYSCAREYHGAWWYNHCMTSNLNGLWGFSGAKGLNWFPLTLTGNVNFSEMKLRQMKS